MSTRLDQLLKFKDQRPDDPFVQYAVGLELKQAGRLEESEQQFRLVVAKFPKYVPTFLHYGQLLEELENFGEAKVIYEQGIACAQTSGDGHAEKELRGALMNLLER